MKSIWLVVGVVCFATQLAAQDVRLKTTAARGALNDASLLRTLRDNEDAAPQDYVAAARADYRRLLTALYASGYYSGTISITIDGIEAANIAPLGAPARINEVVIDVDAGPRFAFGQAAIRPLAPNTEIPEGFTAGERARSDVIGRAASAGVRAWRDEGHAKARTADRQIIARHDQNTLDVAITLAPGPRLTFGDLTVKGNKVVSDDRIREIAGLPVGEVYSPDALDRAERRLRRTGTFDSVAMTEAKQIGPNNTLPITAQIAESKPRRFGFGLELSSIEGLTVSSFWLHRNLLGGAERFRVDGEVAGITGETGGIDYKIQGSFSRPATLGPDTALFVRGELSREDEPDYLLDKASVEVGLTRILTDDLTVEGGVGLLTAREETDLGTREYTLLTLPLKATLDRRDEPTNATSGYFIDLSATPFIGLNDGPNGGRLYGDARVYRSFGVEDGVTFAARGQFGSVVGAEIDEAPADFLFYSGGGGTVRGQPYKSLGIDSTIDGESVTTGGTSFVGAQLEARVAVRDKIDLVGFYDIGHVGDTNVPGENGEWHAGAGIGIRYQTGIGPIRLDIGTQVGDDDAGEDVQVYIGIGQAF